jgi:hypothetical protein
LYFPLVRGFSCIFAHLYMYYICGLWPLWNITCLFLTWYQSGLGFYAHRTHRPRDRRRSCLPSRLLISAPSSSRGRPLLSPSAAFSRRFIFSCWVDLLPGKAALQRSVVAAFSRARIGSAVAIFSAAATRLVASVAAASRSARAACAPFPAPARSAAWIPIGPATAWIGSVIGRLLLGSACSDPSCCLDPDRPAPRSRQIGRLLPGCPIAVGSGVAAPSCSVS